MSNFKEYLLDTNVVIRIWNEYPLLFQAIEKNKEMDYAIYHNIAVEISKKEFRNIDGVPVLSDKFLKLVGHIINEDLVDTLKISKSDINIKYNKQKDIYILNGNKLSRNDYDLICICEKFKKYTLVTGDKGLLNSANIILPPKRVLTFDGFFADMKKFNVI
ncbi:hypothetical protein SH2C18_06380 [Clostridium sediminicola]|uniref:hypothetical protein n=1 Tax=Clostridium sediminicola TaxID=3114879 RepID=UPI0031F25B62